MDTRETALALIAELKKNQAFKVELGKVAKAVPSYNLKTLSAMKIALADSFVKQYVDPATFPDEDNSFLSQQLERTKGNGYLK